MILFKNWKISANGKLLAMQYDNLSRELKVVGEIPEGYTWSAMVQVGELFDIILLEPQSDGSLSSSLTAQQLSVSGDYIVQLKGVKDDVVRHTNQLTVFVGNSLSGDANWPEIPSEFTQIEQRVYEAMNKSLHSEAAAAESAEQARLSETEAYNSSLAAGKAAQDAQESERVAKQAQESANTSSVIAKESAGNAANFAAEAKASAEAAAVSETNARNSEQHAYLSADEARQSASDLAHAVNMAEMHAGAAGDFAALAEQKKSAAETAAQNAESSAEAAAASAKRAEDAAANGGGIDPGEIAGAAEAVVTLAECGVLTPAYESGTFYTDAGTTVYIL